MKQLEEIVFAAILFVVFAVFVGVGWGYSDIPRTVPMTVSIPGLIVAGVQLVKLVLARKREVARAADLDLPMALPEASEEALAGMVESVAAAGEGPGAGRLGLSAKAKKVLAVWAWVMALAAGIDLLGFLVATPIFLCSFIRFVARRSWALSAGIAASFTVAMYLIFYVGLKAQL